MKEGNAVTTRRNTMSELLSRRRLLAQIGVVFGLSFAGCSESGPEPPAIHTVEPQETTPVRAQGEPVTVTRSVSSMNVTIVENGSVDPGNGQDILPFSSWASSRSVQLAESAVRNELTKRVDEYQDSPVEWYLQWVPSNSRFLITTTTTVEPPADNVAWPSRLYDDIELATPNTVTVIMQSDNKTVSNEFPIYTRAKLLPTSEASPQP
jgi:hypothetical protein